MPGSGPFAGKMNCSRSASDFKCLIIPENSAFPRIVACSDPVCDTPPSPATEPAIERRLLRSPSARSKTTTGLAQKLWKAALPVPGTVAGTYLHSRRLPQIPPPTIRFFPSYRYDETRRFPCLVAAVQAPSREIVALQLTFLDPSGQVKTDVQHPRRAIGPLGDGLLRLASVATHIGLAEGFESAWPRHCCMMVSRYGRRSAPTAMRLSRCRRRCAASRFLPIMTRLGCRRLCRSSPIGRCWRSRSHCRVTQARISRACGNSHKRADTTVTVEPVSRGVWTLVHASKKAAINVLLTQNRWTTLENRGLV